jgi:recombinational DNA repair ATPase RecF
LKYATIHLRSVYTPKKASWLNMAEIEFSALSKQCLDRRIGNLKTLKSEVESWAKIRNKKKIKINWQFTKNKARNKFERFYREIINN